MLNSGAYRRISGGKPGAHVAAQLRDYAELAGSPSSQSDHDRDRRPHIMGRAVNEGMVGRWQ